MSGIIVIGTTRAAKLVTEHLLARRPDVAISLFTSGAQRRELKWLQANGVRVHEGVQAIGVDRFSRAITASDGSRGMFDRLILATLDADLARKAKLEVRNGILVNSHMQTSDGYIYAIGECTELAVDCPTLLEEQARVVAEHIYPAWGTYSPVWETYSQETGPTQQEDSMLATV